MKVWIEQGVIWDLQPVAHDGFRKVVRHFKAKAKDLFVLSGREGDHEPDSLHYLGLAWDMRKGDMSKYDIQSVLPGGATKWDVVEYDWGFHVEYDPK